MIKPPNSITVTRLYFVRHETGTVKQIIDWMRETSQPAVSISHALLRLRMNEELSADLLPQDKKTFIYRKTPKFRPDGDVRVVKNAADIPTPEGILMLQKIITGVDMPAWVPPVEMAA